MNYSPANPGGLPPLPPLPARPPGAKRTRRWVIVTVVSAVLLVPGIIGVAVGMTSGDDDVTVYPATDSTSAAPTKRVKATGLPDDGFPCRSVDFVSSDVDGTGNSDAELESAPCADPDAVYIVYERLDKPSQSCPRGDYVEYFTYVTTGGADDFKECLGYNMRAGECFIDRDSGAKRTDCKAPHKPDTLRVVKVYDGTSGKACRKLDAGPLVYSDPGRVMCVRTLA